MAPAMGFSGGILCVWDKCAFRKSRQVVEANFVAIEGIWRPTNTPLLIVSVYAPHEIAAKKTLWDRIVDVIKHWNGEVILMGDFNEVRCAQEQIGMVFNSHHASVFNDFISHASLVNVPLVGYMYTWTDKVSSKMSKIDRFLVSEGLLEIFPHLSGMILTRHLSDHRPLLLHEVVTDYGPKTFCIFSSRFLEDDFTEVVEDVWKNDGVDDSNPMIRLNNKLKILKQRLRN